MMQNLNILRWCLITIFLHFSQSKMNEMMFDGSGDSSEGEWENVEKDMEDLSAESTCLFCAEIFSTQEAVFQHCHSQHMFDIVSFCKKKSIDAISYIKLVNFVRLNKLTSAELLQLPENFIPWSNDEFMKPVNSDDPLLTFDIESFVEEKTLERGDMGENITLPQSEFETLMQNLAAKDLQLQNAFDRIEKMKETARTVLFSNNQGSSQQNCVNSMNQKSDADDYYFSSYDHFAIHHEMLQDKVRTLSYQEAILKNKHLFENKRVMDVGCGTAILSMFAASAGASKVLAVDKSDVIYQAMDIVRENGYDEVIDLYKGRVEDASIPEGKVDVIVSEWMGYFLLFEGMLESVLFARDKYLASGGAMFPDRCTLSVVAISDTAKHEEYVRFWDDVYGFKMSVMKREVIKEANVETVKANTICSNPAVIKELDLLTCSAEDTEFASKFELTMTHNCKVTAIIGYFDCMFEKGLTTKVVMSTSPTSVPTHWKQTIFLLPEPVEVTTGEKIPCRLSCRKNRRDPRTLVMKIDFGKYYNQYYLA